MDSKVRKVKKYEEELQKAITLPTIMQRDIDMDDKSDRLRNLLFKCMINVKAIMMEYLRKTSYNNDDDTEVDSPHFDEWIHDVMGNAVSDKSSLELLDGEEDQHNNYEPHLNTFLNKKSNNDQQQGSNRLLLLAQTLSILNECLMIIDHRSSYAAWVQLIKFMENVGDRFVLQALRANYITPQRFEPDYFPKHCMKRYLLLDVLKEYQQDDFKVLIFVKTRCGVYELAKFLAESPQVNHFVKVGTLLGHGASTGVNNTVGGMSSNKQQGVLSEFKQGTVNVLIATSVAEEGLDVPSCKLVIRMDGIDNALQLIQSRGRARMKQSDFICIHHKKSQDAKKLTRCLMQESKMLRAIDILNKAELYNDDVYLHSRNEFSTEQKGDIECSVNLAHIWEIIWYYNDIPTVVDPITEKVFSNIEKHKVISLLEVSCTRLLGVNPIYQVYKSGDAHKPSFLGSVIIKISNNEIGGEFKGATRMVFTADQSCGTMSEAKIRAAQIALEEFHKRDLIIYTQNSWSNIKSNVIEGENSESKDESSLSEDTMSSLRKVKRKKGAPMVKITAQVIDISVLANLVE
jgi:hypothetical protein